MKKICMLLLLVGLGTCCAGMALSDNSQVPEVAQEIGAQAKDLSRFASYVYDELSMDEIPDGELTEDMLSMLEEEQADRIFDGLLPVFVEKGYVQDLPRSAFLNEERMLWIEDVGSFMSLWKQKDTVPMEEMPTSQVHRSSDCDPAATSNCNYFSIYFWGLEPLFEPCPRCFPAGWVYDYCFSFGFDGVNQMQISLRTEAVPGRFDQPRAVSACFDHETDECLSIAVQYEGQGYVIVYQNSNFRINGIINSCQNCPYSQKERESGAALKAGLWHCTACGAITKAEGE